MVKIFVAVVFGIIAWAILTQVPGVPSGVVSAGVVVAGVVGGIVA